MRQPKVIAVINYPSVTEVILEPGNYRFECWGAQGGIGLTDGQKIYPGGKGSYVSGDLKLEKTTPFYLYVGGKGQDGDAQNNTVAKGGFNGGGNGGSDTSDDEGAGAGGGASDIRLIKGDWSDITSIISRIMVAAGGSGSVFNTYGAPGGTINGMNTTGKKIEAYGDSSTSQTIGNSLGIGEKGRNHTVTPSSGAGGGYYGGFAVDAIDDPQKIAVSSSGSSFISGHLGCVALNRDGNHIDSTIHYSNISFSNTKMKSGCTFFNSPFNRREKGHEGDGAIKITSLDIFVKVYTCIYHKQTGSPFVYSMIFILIS